MCAAWGRGGFREEVPVEMAVLQEGQDEIQIKEDHMHESRSGKVNPCGWLSGDHIRGASWDMVL